MDAPRRLNMRALSSSTLRAGLNHVQASADKLDMGALSDAELEQQLAAPSLHVLRYPNHPKPETEGSTHPSQAMEAEDGAASPTATTPAELPRMQDLFRDTSSMEDGADSPVPSGVNNSDCNALAYAATQRDSPHPQSLPLPELPDARTTSPNREPPAKKPAATPDRAEAKRPRPSSRIPAKQELSGQEPDALIPDVRDRSAPKPKLGEEQLSEQAIRMRTQRLFQRRANGSTKVSAEIFAEWHQRGSRRTMLETIFRQCGYDPVRKLLS